MKIMVLGAGTMGAGIVQTAAQAGHTVIVRDIKQEFVDKGIAGIDKLLGKNVDKGRMSAEDKAAVMGRISGTVDMAAAADCDLIIEAALEVMDIKKAIFKELDEICKPECILASNTSALSVTQIAAATNRADKVIGMHFFNPVPVMLLVELIAGLQTAADTHAAASEFVSRINKTAVSVRNSPGFAVNRILVPMINEAIFVLQEGIAAAEDIDQGMRLGCNHPIGPLALADLIGLDTLLQVMEVFYTGFGDSKYRPAPLLREMVEAGYLGRKAGRGFYNYSG